MQIGTALPAGSAADDAQVQELAPSELKGLAAGRSRGSCAVPSRVLVGLTGLESVRYSPARLVCSHRLMTGCGGPTRKGRLYQCAHGPDHSLWNP